MGPANGTCRAAPPRGPRTSQYGRRRSAIGLDRFDVAASDPAILTARIVLCDNGSGRRHPLLRELRGGDSSRDI